MQAAQANRLAAMDVRAALKEGMARLRAAQVPSHTLAAELLLMHVLGRDRAWLYAHPEEPHEPSTAEQYFALVARRAAGEPTQYLTSKQEFWGLEFEVTPAVLIPRPETEHVVEVALERLGARSIQTGPGARERATPLRLADIGTGSGCLAVALARELPQAEISATDISAGALEVARRNAARHGVADRIHFLQCDLLDALLPAESFSAAERRQAAAFAAAHEAAITSHGSQIASHESLSFDLIVSNPPYVARNEAASLAREVREHEPETALFGGPSGIEMYAQLMEQAGQLLRRGGTLVLELGYGAADHVRSLVTAQGVWVNTSITNDLAGIPRVLATERA